MNAQHCVIAVALSCAVSLFVGCIVPGARRSGGDSDGAASDTLAAHGSRDALAPIRGAIRSVTLLLEDTRSLRDALRSRRRAGSDGDNRRAVESGAEANDSDSEEETEASEDRQGAEVREAPSQETNDADSAPGEGGSASEEGEAGEGQATGHEAPAAAEESGPERAAVQEHGRGTLLRRAVAGKVQRITGRETSTKGLRAVKKGSLKPAIPPR